MDDGEGTGHTEAEGHLPDPEGQEENPAAGEEREGGEGKDTVNAVGNGWSAEDRRRIAAEGMALEEAERQLAVFRKGVAPVRLNRPCRAGDGIAVLSPEEQEEMLAVYQEALPMKRFLKFVPASGAASRMFKGWYGGLHAGGFGSESEREAFLRDLTRYAFYGDLEAAAAKGPGLRSLIERRDDPEILSLILTEAGLNYGSLPKALLKFHAYPEGARTALEEHLVEAALYARDGGGLARLHLTVSREHEQGVRVRLAEILGAYEARLSTRFEIGLSLQSSATNTLAVDPRMDPFRDENGGLVFRPGGHGALLANLDGLDADVIFLKNIDNCVPDRLKPETVRWKKILAGRLIKLQGGIFRRLRLLDGGAGEAEIAEIARFCREKLQVVLPRDIDGWPLAERGAYLLSVLDRPIRVCGMVRNEGEPGGGPFWVEDATHAGVQSLQIVEEAQVDLEEEGQRTLWRAATHFNPVDLVLGVMDFRGGKFPLERYVNPDWALIARKSEKGKDLLALERPGLWNGSMAFWNTLFVEVPIGTFNPVKVVSDLLRPQHLPA